MSINKYIVGITFWHGSNTDYLSSLLCSMLSNFKIDNELDKLNISIISSKRTYSNSILNINTNPINSDEIIIEDVIKRHEYKNKNNIINTELNKLNIGIHTFSNDITYKNLGIDIEFICDGMNLLDKYNNLCNEIKNNISNNILKQNNLTTFIKSLIQMIKKLNNNENYNKYYLLKQLNKLRSCFKLSMKGTIDNLYYFVDSELLYKLFPNYKKILYDKSEITQNDILTIIYTLIDECNIKSIIKKFNELYYGLNDLHNLYGSTNHVSVMCSRNQFFKKKL